MTKIMLTIAAAAALSVGTAARADVLFTSAGHASMANPANSGWCSSCLGTWQAFDSFSLSASSVLTGMTFAIKSDYGQDWDITVSVLDATRSNVLFSKTYAPADYVLNYLGNEVNKVDVMLPAWSLAAGDYQVSWFNPSEMGVPGYLGAHTLYQSTFYTGQVAAFQVTGVVASVPEPATSLMMVLGLSMVGSLAMRPTRRLGGSRARGEASA